MLWKIVRYEKLPDWARVPENRSGRLYIFIKYPWLWCRTMSFNLRNLVRTLKDVRKYRTENS